MFFTEYKVKDIFKYEKKNVSNKRKLIKKSAELNLR